MITPTTVISVFLNGLAFSALIFLLSTGLTLILGLARIVNFAHGSLFLIGGYVSVTVANYMGNWWISVPVSAAVLLIIGAAMEYVLLKRVYGKEELLQLVMTFGVVLIVEDGVKLIWGNVPFGLTFVPSSLAGPIVFGDIIFPKVSLFIIVAATVICVALGLLLHKTKLGKQVIAASSDMDMAGALGINVPFLFTSVFVLGSILAGIAGSLLVLRVTMVPPLGFEYLIYAFAVVVIGGLGSYKGSIYGALIVGISYAFGILLIPDFAIVLIFAVLLLMLLVRPTGLCGMVEEIRPPAIEIGKKVEVDLSLLWGRLSSDTLSWVGGAVLICLLLLFPLVVPSYWVVLATEILMFILLAMSLSVLLRTGMVSIGHAAFFGAGAYAIGLILIHVTKSLVVALLGSVLLVASLAFLIGALSIRHLVIYFSILTMSFAQFVYVVVFKWRKVTGGDDGLVGIPFPSLDLPGLSASIFSPDTPIKYFYFTVAIIAPSFVALRLILRSPFGQVLNGLRENAERVSFLGLNPNRFKIVAFMIGGIAAGLAGALFAPFQSVISPWAAHWTKSIEPVFMCVIGGLNTVFGPAVGAILFIFGKDWLSSMMELWRIPFGLVLIVIAVACPRGIVGYVQLALMRCLPTARKA